MEHYPMSTPYTDPTGSTSTYSKPVPQGNLITILLIALADLILAAGLVLGICGYYGITDRLDQINDSLPPISISRPTPAPTPTDTPTPTPSTTVTPSPGQ